MSGLRKPAAASECACVWQPIEAFTRAPDTDMTLREALDAWPDKVLWINFPSSLHLADTDTIRRTTRELLGRIARAPWRRRSALY
jgi:hypothetical protein